ncbi:MAG: hypothetical protein ACLR5B_11410 [Blautia sp.]
MLLVRGTKYYAGVIGGPIYHPGSTIHQLPSLQDSDSIGQVITGQKPEPKRTIVRSLHLSPAGMSVFDVGWGYEIYIRMH